MLIKTKKQLMKYGHVMLHVRVRAGAPKTEVKDILADGTVKIDIAAPPEKGKANRELARFLARHLAISPENVKIIRGAGDKNKLVRAALKEK